MRPLVRLKGFISNGVRAVMIVTLAFMCLSIAASVFVRNFLGVSFDAIIDINRILFVWITFLGLVFVNGQEKLIRFELLEQQVVDAGAQECQVAAVVGFLQFVEGFQG